MGSASHHPPFGFCVLRYGRHGPGPASPLLATGPLRSGIAPGRPSPSAPIWHTYAPATGPWAVWLSSARARLCCPCCLKFDRFGRCRFCGPNNCLCSDANLHWELARARSRCCRRYWALSTIVATPSKSDLPRLNSPSARPWKMLLAGQPSECNVLAAAARFVVTTTTRTRR